MNKDEAIALLDKYLSGECSPEEYQLVNQAYNLEIPGDGEELAAGEYETSKRLVLRRLQEQYPEIRPARVKLWPRIAVVAAAITAITLGVWLYYSSNTLRHSGEGRNPGLAMNDIAPGKNTATITFDNGEVIDLNDEELDISSAAVEPLKEGSEAAPETPQFLASRIAKSKTVVLSTPRGGTYQVVLPDGTRVWLNAESKISFPSQFSGRERKVILEGEAYFEVAKMLTPAGREVAGAGGSRARNGGRVPFIVETARTAERPGQVVEVLGTHFNINSYADEGATKTTLLEGSVSVSSLATNVGARVTLKPNQQASLTTTNKIEVKEVDPETVIAWKNDVLLFDHEALDVALKKVGRWYNVDIVYETDVQSKARFTGRMSRNRNLSSVIEMLEASGLARFKIEGRRLIVMK